jgi:long-chain acyl-CoA synthetase
MISAEQLARRAAKAAGGLRQLGVGPGDVVAGLLRNDLAAYECPEGASMCGAYYIPLNWELEPAVLRAMIASVKPRLLVGHHDLIVRLREPVAPTVLTLAMPEHLQGAYGITDSRRATSWEDWLELQPDLAEPEASPRGGPSFTSGSTGSPTLFWSRAASVSEWRTIRSVLAVEFGARPGMRALVAGPLYSADFLNLMRVALENGGTVEVLPRFDVTAVVQRLQARVPPTHIHLTPRALSEVAQNVVHECCHAPEFVSHGGARCSVPVKKLARALWGDVFLEHYGASDVGVVSLCDSRESATRPGTVGRPIDGAIVSIRRQDGSFAQPGEPGELWAWSPTLPWRGDDPSAQECGSFGRPLRRPGDWAHQDDARYLFVHGRSGHAAGPTSGLAYSVLEDAIMALPGVVDCALVPGSKLGRGGWRRPSALVEFVPGASTGADGLLSSLRRAQVPDVLLPQQIVFARVPRAESGKLLVARLETELGSRAE